MISISNRKSDDTIIAEFTYSYDPTYWGKNGTRTRVVENILKPDGNRISAQVDYEYDDLYRLVHEHRIAYNGGDPGVAYEYNFAYDAAGNRTSWQTVGGSTINYTYDAANKMLTAGNSTFTYDDKGNTLTETNGSIVTTYTWDYLNRLTEWQKTGETTQSYLYNADGMRVRVTPSGGTATNFVLDGAEVAEEVTGNNTTSFLSSGLASEISGTTRTVYHLDGIGSTRAMSDDSQAVAEAAIYDAYGRGLQDYSISGAPEFGFVGEFRYYADATGLDYLRARYYDPATGRFISRDPIGYRGGLNLYGYAYDNPVNRVDPTGTIAPAIAAILAKIGLDCAAGAAGSAAVDITNLILDLIQGIPIPGGALGWACRTGIDAACGCIAGAIAGAFSNPIVAAIVGGATGNICNRLVATPLCPDDCPKKKLQPTPRPAPRPVPPGGDWPPLETVH